MLDRATAALSLVAGVLLTAAAAHAQNPPDSARGGQDDPSQVHIRMHRKIAPSVVFVMEPTGRGQRGSGVIIDKDGYILTSPTACGQTTTEVSVQMAGQKRLAGKVVGRVNELELVVVKIPAKDLTAVPFGDSDKAKPGAVTYVLGDSFDSILTDDQVAISHGVLSAIYRVNTKQRGTFYTGPVLETSCAVNPNQDGGPLVDAAGHLLGIVTLNYEESKFTGIAIPINRLRPEIERIIQEHKTGVVAKPPAPSDTVRKTEPGWLGADVEEDDDAGGLAVRKLFKNGPAEKGGLRRGDVIRQINAQRVMTRRRFEDILGKLEEGATVKLKVQRDGKDVDLTVTLGRKVYY